MPDLIGVWAVSSGLDGLLGVASNSVGVRRGSLRCLVSLIEFSVSRIVNFFTDVFGEPRFDVEAKSVFDDSRREAWLRLGREAKLLRLWD